MKMRGAQGFFLCRIHSRIIGYSFPFSAACCVDLLSSGLYKRDGRIITFSYVKCKKAEWRYTKYPDPLDLIHRVCKCLDLYVFLQKTPCPFRRIFVLYHLPTRLYFSTKNQQRWLLIKIPFYQISGFINNSPMSGWKTGWKRETLGERDLFLFRMKSII